MELDDPAAESPPMHFDQSESLVHLRLTIRDGQAQPTLYVHHSLADGHHVFSLIEELFSYYTDLVCTGSIRPVTVQPAPEPIEAVLAERGIHKQKRSGIERFMPAMFAYDLPPSRRAAADVKPASPVRVPMASCRLSERETQRPDRVLSGTSARLERPALCRCPAGGVATSRHAEHPGSLHLSPSICGTSSHRRCPRPGAPTLWDWPPISPRSTTTPVWSDLARDIAETFRADLSDGVIQQSLLHFSPQYVGNPPGLPDVVMLSDNGLVPPMRTPPGVELTGTHGELYFAVNAGIEIYFSKIFAGQLNVEYHSHAPAPERSIEAIRSLLCAIAEQHAATGVS